MIPLTDFYLLFTLIKTSGSTALMAACASGSESVASSLLESGADVNALDNVGRHAAHYAAQNRHVRLLLVLSAFGANFDQVLLLNAANLTRF